MSSVTRRTFIQSALVSGIALAADPIADRPAALSDNSPLRIAIAGLGDMGMQHLDLISAIPGTQIVALYDPHSARLRIAGQKLLQKGYPVPQLTMRFERILEDPKIHAVSITSAFPCPTVPLGPLLASRKAALFDVPRFANHDDALLSMRTVGSAKTLLSSRLTDRLSEDAHLLSPDDAALRMIGSPRYAALSSVPHRAGSWANAAPAMSCISWFLSTAFKTEHLQAISDGLQGFPKRLTSPGVLKELSFPREGASEVNIRFLPRTLGPVSASLQLRGERGYLGFSASTRVVPERSTTTIINFLNCLRLGKSDEGQSAQRAFLAAAIARSIC